MKLLINKEEIQNLINNCKIPDEVYEVDNIIDDTIRELFALRDMCNERGEVVLEDFLKNELKEIDLLNLKHNCEEAGSCNNCPVMKQCDRIEDMCGGFYNSPHTWTTENIINRKL